MTDVFTKEKRSWIMSRIRSRDTKIEKIINKKLSKAGVEFERQYKIVGRPDFVIKDKKIAIFLDGDFWHGRQWKKDNYTPPSGYWKEKITRNIRRDRKVDRTLRQQGWKVLRFWESEIEKDPSRCVQRILKELG